MPSSEAHIAAARENQRAIDYLAERIDAFPGWVAVVAFYKALHVVEAVFASDGTGGGHTDDHRTRNAVLKSTVRYQQIWRFYRPLYQASLIARYLRENDKRPEYEVFSRFMPPEKVRSLILNHYLKQVETSAGRLLGGADFSGTTGESKR